MLLTVRLDRSGNLNGQVVRSESFSFHFSRKDPRSCVLELSNVYPVLRTPLQTRKYMLKVAKHRTITVLHEGTHTHTHTHGATAFFPSWNISKCCVEILAVRHAFRSFFFSRLPPFQADVRRKTRRRSRFEEFERTRVLFPFLQKPWEDPRSNIIELI